jgi:DNA repair exonuclease SbcCD nuclease subunit
MQIRFFNEQLYPYMEEHGISTIIQTGDLFDNRQSLALKTFHSIRPAIFGELIKRKFVMHSLVGNHDITLRESLRINSHDLLLQEFIQAGAVVAYDKPTAVKFDSITIDMIPWICSENQEEVSKFMKRKNIGDVLVGHLEIAGAMMYRGIPGHGGLEISAFERYSSVLSGHYHTRSFLDGNRINYVGTPYEMTWSDSGDQRGFTVLDTETLEYTFVPNPDLMFIKIRYKDGCYVNPKTLTGKYVKLIVESKKNLVDFDNFINGLKMADPYDLAIIETQQDLSGGEIDESIEIQDTHTIINQYIDGLNVSVDKNDIKQYMQSLFHEASNR